MTETLAAIQIPDGVKDNSRAAVRVQWRGVRPVKLVELEQDKQYASLYGYTIHEWDDTDRDGNRVTLTRLVNKSGSTADLYATYYYTRVACTDCDSSWAGVYLQVTDANGVTHPPAPFCGTHADVVRAITRRERGCTWAESEPLNIGQH